jgi:hypothetical protein
LPSSGEGRRARADHREQRQIAQRESALGMGIVVHRAQ